MIKIVSGLKPSGALHIGNYLGMLKPAVDLQEKPGERFYFIADYHSLTLKYAPQEKRKEIFQMALDAIAAGLDPEKSTIFIQSDIPEHANLAWIFNCLIPVNKLQGMIEYKERLSEGAETNVGLLDYPVLMAADILLYRADLVPIGEDQRQHMELTRDIVRIFNKRFGKTFKEPKAMLSKASRLMSLDNPKKKMSKSLPQGCLYLADEAKTVVQKIKSAVTDSGREIIYDLKKKPGISNLLLIYSELSESSVADLEKKFKSSNYSEFKDALTRLIIEKFRNFRHKRKELIKNHKEVLKILKNGREKASIIASKTMSEIRERAGLL